MRNEPSPAPAEDRLEAVLRQRQERTRRQRRSALFTIAAIVLLCAAVVLILSGGKRSAEAEPGIKVATDEDTITIAAVGDISISDAQLADAMGVSGYDFSTCFLGVADLLDDADLTVGNLECVFAGAPYGGSTCSAPEILADTLAGLGFDLLQTANSATIMGGMSGLASTIDTVRAAGMLPVGTFASKQERQESGGVTMVEVNGTRIAFIAFTKGLGNMSLPENSEFAVNCLYSDYNSNYSDLDTDGIVKAMTAAKKQKPDLMIALVHWGSEYSREISSSQKKVAQLLYENGADVILGTHSHMVGQVEAQTITMEDGSTRDVLTAYDLGNFYTDSTKADTQTSIILKLTFTKDKWGKLTLTDWGYTPIYCADYGSGTKNRYQVMSVETAMELYKQDYVYHVPDETYAQMEKDMEQLPAVIDPINEKKPTAANKAAAESEEDNENSEESTEGEAES